MVATNRSHFGNVRGLLEDLYYFTILLLYYLVKIKWVKIYQCTCVYIGIVHLYIKSDFYHLTFAFRFITPNFRYDDP